MTTTVIVAALSATCTVLIIVAWREHDRAKRATVRAEEADSWSLWFQDAAEEQAKQLHTVNAELSDLRRRHGRLEAMYTDLVRRRHGRLEAMYTDLVRRRLADNYAIVDRNIIGRSRMS